jgi:hypothetical protein
MGLGRGRIDQRNEKLALEILYGTHDGLEREVKVLNQLEGVVCTMCAPRDQEKSIVAELGQWHRWSDAVLGQGRRGDLLE